MSEARRAKFRQGLHHLYLPIYDALCAELPEDWQPFWGVRTFDEQAQIYAQGRTLPGAIVTDAEAGESPHNYGCASDWTLFVDKKPLWIALNDSRWAAYQHACANVGARWGGQFKHQDRYHNELPINVRWAEIGENYKSKGLNAALTMIERSTAV